MLGLVIGATLRLVLIDARSLWFDEAFTVLLSEKSLEEIWTLSTTSGSDPHPRGFKTFLHYWIEGLGRSEFSVRLPTAYASILNLALLGLLARRLFGRTTALVAVSLLAVAPLDIWYAQEVRMYMWVTTFGLLFAVFLTINHWLALPGLLLALTAGLYVDLPMFPLALGLTALWFVQWWQGERSMRALVIVLGALAGAWILVQPIVRFYTFTFEELNRIFVFREIRTALGLPSFESWQYGLLLIAISVVVGLGAMVAQRILRRPDLRRWIAPVVLIGFALVTAATPIPRLYGIKRVVLVGWPYIILLVAWLLTIDWKRGRRIFAVLVSLSLVASIATLTLVAKDDWRGASAYISQSGSDDIVWVDPAWNRGAYAYYVPSAQMRSGSLDRLQEVSHRDVWLVAERFPGLDVPSSPSEEWLDANMTLVGTQPFYRLEVRHYKPAD